MKSRKVPMILHFGDKDHSIPLADIEKIKAARPEVPVYVYPGAGHGFIATSAAASIAAAAELAGKRTMEFFASTIRCGTRCGECRSVSHAERTESNCNGLLRLKALGFEAERVEIRPARPVKGGANWTLAPHPRVDTAPCARPTR